MTMRFKIDGEIYDAIHEALKRTARVNEMPVLNMRQAWDVFHRAWETGAINGHVIYAHYNDAHIDTALKRIFKI
jgi:hypothetical protein